MHGISMLDEEVDILLEQIKKLITPNNQSTVIKEQISD